MESPSMVQPIMNHEVITTTSSSTLQGKDEGTLMIQRNVPHWGGGGCCGGRWQCCHGGGGSNSGGGGGPSTSLPPQLCPFHLASSIFHPDVFTEFLLNISLGVCCCYWVWNGTTNMYQNIYWIFKHLILTESCTLSPTSHDCTSCIHYLGV